MFKIPPIALSDPMLLVLRAKAVQANDEAPLRANPALRAVVAVVLDAAFFAS
jgi:hypothetical protein